MNQGRIIVITGSPGTGKTTTASIVAKESDMDKSVHMHTDDFFHYLSKGAIPPHLPESNKQNLVVIEAFLEAAKRYARGGYDVIVDGIVGPWFLEPWKALAQEDYEVRLHFRHPFPFSLPPSDGFSCRSDRPSDGRNTYYFIRHSVDFGILFLVPDPHIAETKNTGRDEK